VNASKLVKNPYIVRWG